MLYQAKRSGLGLVWLTWHPCLVRESLDGSKANADGLSFVLCESSAPLSLGLFYLSHHMIQPLDIFSSLNTSKPNQRYNLHMQDIYYAYVQAEFCHQVFDVL